MSRFYDALRQANSSPTEGSKPLGRPRKFSPAHVGDVVSELLTAEEKPPISAAIAGQRPAPSTTDLDGALHSLLQLADRPANEAQTGSANSGSAPDVQGTVTPTAEGASRTRLRLDPKARLIPNAADVEVVEYYRRLRTKILQQQETNPDFSRTL
jgi:hypothetical protein